MLAISRLYRLLANRAVNYLIPPLHRAQVELNAPGAVGCCGIPGSRVPAVLELFEAFFPSDGRCVDISTNGDANALESKAVKVPWGSTNQEIEIIDGPSALGYIFSVATPPQGAAACDLNYIVPLQAVYSSCVYLAYISNVWIDEDTEDFIQDVPFMSCAMYFTDGVSNPPVHHFLLGSTYTVTFAPDGSTAAGVRAKVRLMNSWREKQVLGPALQSYSPHRVLPPNDHFLPPTVEEKVVEVLWKMLLSTCLAISETSTPTQKTGPPLSGNLADRWVTVPELAADTAFAAMVVTLNAAWNNPAKPQPELLLPFPRKNHWDSGPLKDELRRCLWRLAQLRWNDEAYNRNAPDTRKAFENVFNIMFFPRMFHPKPPPNSTEPDLSRNEVDMAQIMGGQAAYDKVRQDFFRSIYRCTVIF